MGHSDGCVKSKKKPSSNDEVQNSLRQEVQSKGDDLTVLFRTDGYIYVLV